MQNTTSLWDELYQDSYRVESKVMIDGVEYPVVMLDSHTPTFISLCRITRQLFTDAAPIGNATAATLEIVFTPSVEPAYRAEVRPYKRLVSDDGIRSDWLPDGVYWIGNRKGQSHGQLRIVCYDALRKAEQPFMDELDTGDWPRKADIVVQECASKLGVSIDSRTSINSTYAVEYPENYNDITVREILEQIAFIHGGNWTMTPEGELRLVCVFDTPPETNYLIDQRGNAITFGGVRILV